MLFIFLTTYSAKSLLPLAYYFFKLFLLIKRTTLSLCDALDEILKLWVWLFLNAGIIFHESIIYFSETQDQFIFLFDLLN